MDWGRGWLGLWPRPSAPPFPSPSTWAPFRGCGWRGGARLALHLKGGLRRRQAVRLPMEHGARGAAARPGRLPCHPAGQPCGGRDERAAGGFGADPKAETTMGARESQDQDENMTDAVLVRVYGRKTELIVDRANELHNFQVLQDHGCAPNLFCTFENGYCYEFMPGKALGPDHIRQPYIFRLIAQEMAKMHRIHTNGSLPKPCLWHRLYKYFNIVKNEFVWKTSNLSLHQEVHIPSLEVLEEEIRWMKEHLSQLRSPIVFCHNDLLSKNIIYNKEEGLVRFIDYEYTGYNYQAFDIGNHFNEFAGLNEVDYSLYPCKELQFQWLRYYLQAYKRLCQEDQGEESKRGEGSGAVSEEELESLYIQVNQFALASHFLWACWGLIQAQFSTIDFNFARYADIRFKQYFKTKPVVTSLKMSK